MMCDALASNDTRGEEAGPPGREPVAKHRILVVDDSDANLALLERMLSQQGYSVRAARDGEEAIRSAELETPDLVIMDVMMPVMTGLEATAVLRRRAEWHAIPILLLTGLSDVKDKVAGLEAGADDFLSKPFNRVELLARVRSLLRIRDLHGRLEARSVLLQQVLNRYVAEEVATEILRDPERNLALGGKSCVVSVLFADIRGFTSFAECRPAVEVIETLNSIFGMLVPVIHRHDGTFDKYIGDAVMAFYGAPLPTGGDAERAVRTAVEMQGLFARMRSASTAMDSLALGIGIASGEAVVGNLGTASMMDYTVIGDTPNTAARLQETALGGETLIDESTFRSVSHLVTARSVEPLALKGRSGRVSAYVVDAIS